MNTPTTPLPPGIHFGVPRGVYNADPGINQSKLKAFAKAKTPAHFRYEQDNPPEEDKDFLRRGSALDTLIWSPSEFEQQFEVAPVVYPCEPTKKDPRTMKPWTMQANWCKDWWQERLDAGITPLTVTDRDCVRGMLDGLQEHPDIPAILENCERHVVIIANHPTLGYRMKGELDLWPSTHSAALGKWYFELKTTGVGADDQSFHEHCFKLGYLKQVAWYLSLARYAGFESIHSCGILAVESEAPYKAKMHYAHYDDEEVVKERQWIEDWLPRYMACVESGIWPGYPTTWSRVRYPYWAMKDRQPGENEVLT